MKYYPLVMADYRPMTDSELKDRKAPLLMLAPYHVPQQYPKAYERCRMVDDRIPKARAFQELVACWKVQRRWGDG